jgi:hypothetical protein
VVGKAAEYAERWGVGVAVDTRGPVGGLLDDLRRARVPLIEMADGQMTKACADLQQKVVEGIVRHRAQPPLDRAVQGAAIRASGDAWRWTRSGSDVDICPLVAVTVALWASRQPAGPSKYWSADELWDD